jgi:hypothetical protein
MTKEKNLIITILIMLALSCMDPSKNIPNKNNQACEDTIILTNNSYFYSCCRVASTYIILKLPSKPEIVNFNSTSGGGLLYKRYKIKDDLFLTFLYNSYPIYEADILEYWQFCLNCTNSEIINDGVNRAVKIRCVDSIKICQSINSYDRNGYTYINIEDLRSTSDSIKDTFAVNFFSNVVKKDTIFHFNKTIIGQLNINNFENFSGHMLGQVKAVNTNDYDGDELFLAFKPGSFDTCLDLYSAAERIINENLRNKEIQIITLIEPVSRKNEFKRIASFVVRNNTDTIMSDFEGFDGTLNYVDCIWIDESFADKPLIQQNCDRWKKGM